jgi:PPOX class probable F420-dependent enzyme
LVAELLTENRTSGFSVSDPATNRHPARTERRAPARSRLSVARSGNEVRSFGQRFGMAGPGPELGRDMTATSFDPHALLAASNLGVLATIKSDGRPQLSPVMPFYDRPAGVIHVSMRAGLAKTANLRRDARATLEVTSADGRAWATVEGTATLTGPGSDPDGPEVQALVDYYRSAAGEHPDWAEYRAAMVSDRRVLMTMTVEHVYGTQIG